MSLVGIASCIGLPLGSFFVESNDGFLADERLFVSIVVHYLGEVFIYLIIVLNQSALRSRSLMAIAFLGAVISCGCARDLGEKGTRQRASLLGQDSVDGSLVGFYNNYAFNFICVLRLLLMP